MELIKKDVRVTSNEIAEMTGKNHTDVIRDIRKTLKQFDKAEMLSEIWESTYQGTRRLEKNYEMTKDGLMLIITGYSATHRMKLIKYCRELEDKIQSMSMDSYRIEDAVIRAEKWILEAKERKALENKIKKDEPKVDYYEKVLTSEGGVITSHIAKEIGMSATTLNKVLSMMKIQYKVGGTWVLYKSYEDKGYMDTKTVALDNNGKTFTKRNSVWTEKGREFILGLKGEILGRSKLLRSKYSTKR